MLEKIYKIAPHPFQNIMISMFNFLAYRERYGENYKQYLNVFNKNKQMSYQELLDTQQNEWNDFINHAKKHSIFYKKLYQDIKFSNKVSDINSLPIINKEDLRKNINQVYTISKNEGIISKTGGTTGKSLKVLFTKDDMQKRFAQLDSFRGIYGYKLGKKTAWFSGKALLNNNDIKKNRFWKYDFLHKVRYYSTFHIHSKYLEHYLNDLIKFKPEFIVGFPSSIIEIAKFGIRNDIKFPKGIIKAIFPTAETVTNEIKKTLETFFHTKVIDQYASSEGAPFIFECPHGNLHLELQSGIFEVLDENNQQTNEGRLVITSFTTHGTPLIRYDIGDRIKMSENQQCTCGNNNPIVEKIMGRVDDYIYSPETGKINLGNISNTLKDVSGIVKFQIIQNEIEKIIIKIVIDKNDFSEKDRKKFIQNWRDRIGNNMELQLNIVEKISVEKSGKYRMVKNNIKHLLDIQ